MTATLRPKAGFDWTLINWGAPDQRRTKHCSYCDEPLPLDDDQFVPLILWNAEGWCAEFCDTCQRKWWGLIT
ncbi:MAG: hypothetical protein J2P55_03755 [Rhizobiales bacterium]|nr:hypothetical protein [Hyphomicrobiales bacterium]